MLIRSVTKLSLGLVFVLSFSSTASAQIGETRKSVMRPKSIGANLQRRQRQTENSVQRDNGVIVDHSHVQHGHGTGHSMQPGFPVQPVYPYGGVYPYGYTIGNPGFSIPPYEYGYHSGYGNVYGYGNSYGGYGYPIYGFGLGYGHGSITRGTPPSQSPGSHYFGNPHASQYIPGTR
ncbi:hypothetical protein [Rubripirellula reticaptiva]|uniref:Uncharacterized protein n=1 Tax=Rubripirellula reticaptiva TaxID=2528013 RepID=A0A5C6EN23_9BACT|nr:hypothetical protein [Rubripirellula reticaptiva]TWU51133.1 hypothetical protein Poly59_27220 [Rubripirellula reticaptiva]